MAVVVVGNQSAAAQSSPLIINEALANEPGSAVSLEWVELYNQSDLIVDLANFIFIDAPDTMTLTNLALAPSEYAILARRVTGDQGQDSFESRWGDDSGVWGDAECEKYPVIEVKMKLRNSTDTVVIFGPLGETSSLWWTGDAGDGVSWERLRPDNPDNESSFLLCADPEGATPGRINSHTPRPNDLAVDSESMTLSPFPPRDNQACTLYVTVENIGLGWSQNNVLTIADDTNFNGEGEETEVLAEHEIPMLAEGQSSITVVELLLDGGVRGPVEHYGC